MNDTTIKWQSPPPSKTQRGKWDATAEALRERRGEWALIAEGVGHGSLSTNINAGALKSFQPVGAFESVARRNADGAYDIYARFVGGHR